MHRNPRLFRAMMLTLGIALALPVALTLTRDVASASGYIIATGRDGEPTCIPAEANDC